MTTFGDSKTRLDKIDFGEVVQVEQPDRAPSILVVCEHASNRIPAGLKELGLSPDVVQSHVAWDPGALGVARSLAKKLSSALVTGNVSRLVYDCNRPPDAPSAVPERSEAYDINGNIGLSPEQRQARVKGVFEPFSLALGEKIKLHRKTLKLMITVHSFTPVFNGVARSVELGVLHGRDNRFALAMMDNLPGDWPCNIRLNQPYDASDGVVFTLDEHGARNGLLNVMIEIRNDLIRTPEEQEQTGHQLAKWIKATLQALRVGREAL